MTDELTDNKVSVEYLKYEADVFKRDDAGNIRFDVNGNTLVLHRAGDYILDGQGDRIVARTNTSTDSVPSLEKLSDSELAELKESTALEQASRPMRKNHV